MSELNFKTFPSNARQAVAFELFKRSPEFSDDPVKAVELYEKIYAEVQKAYDDRRPKGPLVRSIQF